MSNTLALRAVGLGAVTLLAAILAVVLATRGDHAKTRLPQGVGQWYRGLAAPYGPAHGSRRGACGTVIGPDTPGVAHPVLPCGVKIYLSYGGRSVLTQVIDRGPTVPGRTFDVTRALARTIGLTGTQPIRWRFAR